MSLVVWFTGLSGAGKTTIALNLKEKLARDGLKVEILDGDVVRNTLHKKLGFSREDIRENNRLIANLAKEQLTKFDVILVPIISPYIEDRAMAKKIIGEDKFIELFVNTSLEKCMERDVKGLYKKALSGEINQFIGIQTPYEPPLNPNLTIDTTQNDVEESVNSILFFLKKRLFK